MRNFHLLLSFLFLPCIVSGQFIDDFHTGRLTSWHGDTTDFKIDSNGILQLEAMGSGISTISRSIENLIDTVWSGSVHMDFLPSNSNQLTIILASFFDKDTIHYGLQIGETGSPDSLYFLMKKNGATKVWGLGTPFDDKVQFDYHVSFKKGNWFLRISPSNQNQFLDTIDFPSRLSFPSDFSVQCKYTSSRSDKFYFDDISAGMEFRDQVSPILINYELVDDQHLFLVFDEKIRLPITDHFESDQDDLEISKIEYYSDSSEIQIEFRNPLQIAEEYSIHFEIYDLFGNVLGDSLKVSFFPINLASPGQLLITEIMADPSPPKSLPECEYVEIYNNSDHFFRLSDYTLADDSKQVFLPDTIIRPNTHLAISSKKCRDLFLNHKNILFVDNFPTLNNHEDHVLILDYVGRQIHSVQYERSWYKNPLQSEGGWSLEMKDISSPCLGNENWSAADFFSCGSPGQENTNMTDISARILQIKSIEVESEDQLIVYFTQNILWDKDKSKATFQPRLPINRISQLTSNSLQIILDEKLNLGDPYQLKIEHLFNCIGDETLELSRLFFVPRLPDFGELKLNEILFNPYPNGNDFIEIKNTTEEYISLKDICILHQASNDTSIICLNDPLVMDPESQLALTTDTNVLKSFYQCGHLAEAHIPSLPDSGGFIQLLIPIGGKMTVIDSFNYDEKMHNPGLDSKEGVSLEKINHSGNKNNNRDWHSASSRIGFATPGLMNSQSSSAIDSTESIFSLNEDHFSPNQDGYLDFVTINLHLPKTGYHARVQVYSHTGRFVSTLIGDEVISDNEHFIWQGQSDDGELSPPGMYIIQGQFAHPDGDLIREKITLTME